MSEPKKTYCNPIPLPGVPQGKYGEGTMTFTGEGDVDFRSIADPSAYYENGKWYLYPSYGMTWTSEDFVSWQYHRTVPDDPKYSPAIVKFRGKYLFTSHSNPLRIGDSPLGPFRELGFFIDIHGNELIPVDPALFVDDDGRLYLYGVSLREGDHKNTFITGTYGAELDPDDPRHLITERTTLFEFDGSHEWERFGEHRQNTLCGWIEGQWMYKKNGRYYLIHSPAGTQFSPYCLAAYISDEGPLAGFHPQKNSPFLEKPNGFLRGAGHGSVVEGPNDTLWAFYTGVIGYRHIYERVIGMDPLAINEDGELYAPHGATEFPCYGALDMKNAIDDNRTGWLPLTARQRAKVRVSSQRDGHFGFYALDESMLTDWRPAPDDERPTLTVDLQGNYFVHAARVTWRDFGLDYKDGVLPRKRDYLIEGRPDNEKDEWVTLYDSRPCNEEYLIDYRDFPAVACESVRITLFDVQRAPQPGLVDFTVFGVRNETV